MKKIGVLIIISFIAVSSFSIFFTIDMGRNFEDFNDDDEDDDDGDDEMVGFMANCNNIYSTRIVPFKANINIIETKSSMLT